MQLRRSGYLVAAMLAVATSVSVWSLVAHGSWRPRALQPPRSSGESEAQTRATMSLGDARAPVLGPALPQPAASTTPVFWHAVDGQAPTLAGMVNGLVRDAQHVRLDLETIRAIDVGSLVSIELPGGEHYQALVQEVLVHENGDRSWSGHIEGFGTRFPVVYTQGDSATFGTIATPSGLYSLEALGEDAVLYRDEREGLQDPNLECQILPG